MPQAKNDFPLRGKVSLKPTFCLERCVGRRALTLRPYPDTPTHCFRQRKVRDSEVRDSESKNSEARDSENGQIQGPLNSDTP